MDSMAVMVSQVLTALSDFPVVWAYQVMLVFRADQGSLVHEEI